MPPGEDTSKNLAGVLIPLLVWGMVAALMLHLIGVRSFLLAEGGASGEAKLRQATLSFVAGVILIERLGWQQGPSIARIYGWLLGLTMTIFAAHHAWVFRLPVSPWLVFGANEAVFMTLWWVTARISAACAVRSEEAVAAAAETGILARRAKPTPPASSGDVAAVTEAAWEARLSARHPGRVIFWFSLVALPAFGGGFYLFPPEASGVRMRLGALLFIYLWCAMTLLSLASLRQLAVYFQQRDATLGGLVGVVWAALGCVSATAVLALAFVLPQPLTEANGFVREQIVSACQGWESRAGGVQDTAGKPTVGTARTESAGASSADAEASALTMANVADRIEPRYEKVDALHDPYLSEMARQTGVEPEVQRLMVLSAATRDGLLEVFERLLKIVLMLAGFCGMVILFGLVWVTLKRLGDGLFEWWRLSGRGNVRGLTPIGRRRTREADELAGKRFRTFHNPFGPGGARDGEELVRYLWEAMIAWCADAGCPCRPDQTPAEFLATRPRPLAGFEKQAHDLAEWLSFSEFSGKPLPPAARPALERFWTDLQSHVARGL